jgi:hypothetical protein
MGSALFSPDMIRRVLTLMTTPEVRQELKGLFAPLVEELWFELTPYLYLMVGLMISLFLFVVATLTLVISLLRHRPSWFPLPDAGFVSGGNNGWSEPLTCP